MKVENRFVEALRLPPAVSAAMGVQTVVRVMVNGTEHSVAFYEADGQVFVNTDAGGRSVPLMRSVPAAELAQIVGLQIIERAERSVLSTSK